MGFKLDLDRSRVDHARETASDIADRLHAWIGSYTTTTIERAVARLFGIDGVDAEGVPLPNVLIQKLQTADLLDRGLAQWLACAVVDRNESPQTITEAVAVGILDVKSIAGCPAEKWREVVDRMAKEAAGSIKSVRLKREEMIARAAPPPKPLLYVIVATGNVYEDAVQARAAAIQGADIVAVIRHTGQSLLDYVPYGPTTEGFGGTYATQENFRLVREALDEAGEQTGRYIQLVNYASGLCMPEISVMGAMERLDMMLNDAMYGVLFRDINMQRTFIDQHFSRMINAFAGITINTGEDNYLTTADAYEKGHTVLASQLINEQLALRSGLSEEQIGLGHAFEINPAMEDGLLMEIAQAQLCRELFPRSPLKYMPPTKHVTGDIFKTYLANGMFNLVSVLTGQEIQLLGMLTEAIHTPFLSDRYLSIASGRYIFNNARHLGEEIFFKEGGRIQKRAARLLDDACSMLQEIKKIGLEASLEQGMFADIKRSRDGGKGLEGVITRHEQYYNPFFPIFMKRQVCGSGGL
ncbi:MAG TPA: lysine 5,6-aminomutase subunit alpha [Candidatus Limnocylindrales bacterium]|nr:lysine 5,6-aminomutase subunit alpha [Candidatus Limnocylindrales bacterium]